MSDDQINDVKQIFYFERLIHPNVAEILGQEPDIELLRLEYDGPSAHNWEVMSSAHAYNITADRHGLPDEYFADAAFLKRCPSLLVVSSGGSGFNTADMDACTEAGVLVVCQVGANRESVAEHTLGMMLVLAKRIAESDKLMRRTRDFDRNTLNGRQIFEKTIGIIGLGNTGSRVAELCSGMFNMRVLAYDPYLTPAQFTERGAESVEFDQIFSASDFVSVHCPLNKETELMIGAREYGLMKETAYFITNARGGIHDELALAEALGANKLAGAGLDVWDLEPPPTDHPLLKFDNVIASPHLAGVTQEARAKMGDWGARQLIDIFRGKRPRRLQNPEAWDKYAKRFEAAFGFSVES